MGMLGTIAAGAAQGYGQADNANVAEANKQIEAQNLQQSEAEIRDMYERTKEMRQIQYAAAYRGAMSNATAPLVQQNLAAQGMITAPDYAQEAGTINATAPAADESGNFSASDVSKFTPQQRADFGLQPVATDQQVILARGRAMADAGFVDADKVMGAVATISASDNRAEAMKYVGDVRAMASDNRNAMTEIKAGIDAQAKITQAQISAKGRTDAAQIHADAYMSDKTVIQRQATSARIGLTAARKDLSNAFTPEAKAAAQAAIAGYEKDYAYWNGRLIGAMAGSAETPDDNTPAQNAGSPNLSGFSGVQVK